MRLSLHASAELFVTTVLDNNQARWRPSTTKRHVDMQAGAIQFDLTQSLSHIDLVAQTERRVMNRHLLLHPFPPRLPRALPKSAYIRRTRSVT